MPKAKTDRGHRFVKELGGAFPRTEPSRTAQFLVQKHLIKGRTLDYGCGYGVDAKAFKWESYDPYYQQKLPPGPFDTIVCNLVANTLIRSSRLKLYKALEELLAENGKAYIAVARNIPQRGKCGPRHRIQNYVILTLPTAFSDKDLEVYVLAKGQVFEDKTKEFV